MKLEVPGFVLTFHPRVIVELLIKGERLISIRIKISMKIYSYLMYYREILPQIILKSGTDTKFPQNVM